MSRLYFRLPDTKILRLEGENREVQVAEMMTEYSSLDDSQFDPLPTRLNEKVEQQYFVGEPFVRYVTFYIEGANPEFPYQTWNVLYYPGRRPLVRRYSVYPQQLHLLLETPGVHIKLCEDGCKPEILKKG